MACIRFFRSFCLERSRWQQRAALRPGEGSPLFRRGSRCARAFEQGRVLMLTRESKQERLRERLKIGMRNGLGYPACRHPSFAGFRYSRACPIVRPLPVWRGVRRVATTADRLKYVDLQRVKANR